MREEDIRPDALFDEYLAVARRDIQGFFSRATFRDLPCPACGSETRTFAFRKFGFTYTTCDSCGTLYVCPRPEAVAFARYYTDSASARFWATDFYRKTEDARRNLLIRPKALRVKEIIEKYGTPMSGDAAILDIGAGYGVFCEELQHLLPGAAVIAVEPSRALAARCRERGIPTIEKFLEVVDGDDLGGRRIIAATAFELFEHIPDPGAFLTRCSSLLPAGAILILTTLNWMGFDLQVLRERSRSITPPAHINFFTPSSLAICLERNGFQPESITTPGKLDVDIASKEIGAVKDPFLRSILSSSGEVKESFQKFLQEAGFSSHMMAVARRK